MTADTVQDLEKTPQSGPKKTMQSTNQNSKGKWFIGYACGCGPLPQLFELTQKRSLLLLPLLHFDRINVRRPVHIRAEDDPLQVRCEGDVRFQVVVVLR